MAYSLIGSTKLGSDNTTIEVTGLPEKENLFVLCYFMETSSSINPNLSFNGDNAGGNYANRRNFNFGTDSGSINFNNIEDLWNSDPFPVEVVLNIQNIQLMEKIVMSNASQANTAGSGTAPNSAVLMAKWVNKVDFIETITFVSNHAFATDSECAVYGSD